MIRDNVGQRKILPEAGGGQTLEVGVKHCRTEDRDTVDQRHEYKEKGRDTVDQRHEYKEKSRDTVDQIHRYRKRAETQLIRDMSTKRRAETQLIRYMGKERRAETQLIRYMGTEKGQRQIQGNSGLKCGPLQNPISLLLQQWLSSYIKESF
jgi:hypothetical protein